MDLSKQELVKLINEMRSAYARGENAMAFAREALKDNRTEGRNQRLAILVSYDLQAGTYVDGVRANSKQNQRWCHQAANLIAPVLPQGGSLLEVGVGEATTLTGVLAELGVERAFGLDISWSRINVAQNWLHERSQVADLFVGDLLNIPMSDNSVDVVYSSHSLEPNGGLEEAAITECLRVARSAVVLIEPIYELASAEAQARMRHHGYMRGLRETAERLGADVVEYRLLEHTSNPLNPSAVLTLRKSQNTGTGGMAITGSNIWQCPLSGTKLEQTPEGFFAPEVGISYPVLAGVPLLKIEHAVVASRFNGSCRVPD